MKVINKDNKTIVQLDMGEYIEINGVKLEGELILARNLSPDDLEVGVRELTLPERIQALEEITADKLTNEELNERINLFEDFSSFESGLELHQGKIFKYEGKLYRVLQNHQKGEWKPSEAVSLYVEIGAPNVISEWKQPTGSHDAYQVGDKVLFNGEVWVNKSPNNVYQPGVYGWEKEN